MHPDMNQRENDDQLTRIGYPHPAKDILRTIRANVRFYNTTSW
jgi:hypothetical protein